ncbi:hypothetical protein VKT23_019853 [Stygiomarasmius scandens]|uniref:Beta-xylanase n=1 Tax=Marasmiellus scandens TaxID=2682957 RepID=A0ABR1INH2_9AGAR
MQRYRGKVYAWDVVNEPISDTTNATYRETIWTHKLGEESVAKALTYAREADPVPKLYINDYDIEGINAKSNSLYEVVKSLKRDGVPLDAIGFQSHITLGQVPSTMKENMQRFVDLGLDVAITELDINLRGPANATALAQQAKDYHSVVSACLEIERCVSVTVWVFRMIIAGFLMGRSYHGTRIRVQNQLSSLLQMLSEAGDPITSVGRHSNIQGQAESDEKIEERTDNAWIGV